MKIIAIGVSAGGPEILKRLLKVDIVAPVLLAQHNLPDQVRNFAWWLGSVTGKRVVVVHGDTPISKGTVHVPAAGMDLVVKDRRTVGVKRNSGTFFPSIDELFKSVALIFKEDAVGIVLGGLAGDGVEGSKEIVRNGGTLLVQMDAKFDFMPNEVLRKVKGAVGKRLDEIIDFLRLIAG